MRHIMERDDMERYMAEHMPDDLELVRSLPPEVQDVFYDRLARAIDTAFDRAVLYGTSAREQDR